MASSKLTSKFQVTIPQNIASLLDLKSGDRIIFQVTNGGQVIIKKATTMDLIYQRSIESTLTEWNSQNDEQDYCDL